MLVEYRRSAPTDATLLQPLANACWRASCFEWALYRDVDTTRRLWGESARALAQGFSRRRPGFDPSPDQFILALHLSIAGREREAFQSLALTNPNLREGALHDARAFQGSRAHFHLAEGYAYVARALVEGKAAPARAAIEALTSARKESDHGWWTKQFPEALDAAWRISEHDAVCLLLTEVAKQITRIHPTEGYPVDFIDELEDVALEFASLTDETLTRLEHFIEHDANHHPKLYVWLPGVALCALATSAGLPMEWLRERHETNATAYARLPPELLRHSPQA
jgi:hypothetical protein